MPKFKVYVHMKVRGSIEVEAPDPDAAIAKVYRMERGDIVDELDDLEYDDLYACDPEEIVGG